MYCAFYLDPKLEHLAFQPWWCVSLIGLRYNEILIFIGGVLTGLYLVVVNPNPTAHIMFNLSINRSNENDVLSGEGTHPSIVHDYLRQ